jgi:hypothetical protein
MSHLRVPELISTVTEAVSAETKAWQSRPLESHYAIVYLSAWINAAVYLNNLAMLGINATADATNKLAVASAAILLPRRRGLPTQDQ